MGYHTPSKSGSCVNSDLHVAEVQREGKQKETKKKELQILDQMKKKRESKQHASHMNNSRTSWLSGTRVNTGDWNLTLDGSSRSAAIRPF